MRCRRLYPREAGAMGCGREVPLGVAEVPRTPYPAARASSSSRQALTRWRRKSRGVAIACISGLLPNTAETRILPLDGPGTTAACMSPGLNHTCGRFRETRGQDTLPHSTLGNNSKNVHFTIGIVASIDKVVSIDGNFKTAGPVGRPEIRLEQRRPNSRECLDRFKLGPCLLDNGIVKTGQLVQKGIRQQQLSHGRPFFRQAPSYRPRYRPHSRRS